MQCSGEVVVKMTLSSDYTVRRAFLSAIRHNDLQSVRACLIIGADVNWMDDEGHFSGLFFAVEKKDLKLLDLLLDCPRINVNLTDRELQTPLMEACKDGSPEVVNRLCLHKDIAVNQRDGGGGTALHHAVVYNRPSCVRVLRGVAGLDWNVKSDDGYPVTTAVYYGRVEILKVLLSVNNLDLAVTDCGKHLAHFAVADTGPASPRDQIRCVELLSQDSRVDWNVRDYHGDTPIMTAIKHNKKEIVKILSENPLVDLNLVDREGKYVETIARENGMSEVFNPMLGVEARVRRRAVMECPVSEGKLVLLYLTTSYSKVCFQSFKSEVYQCLRGHFVCSSCEPKVKVN